MGSRYLPALFVRHKETSGDAVVTSPIGCGELPRERFGARGLWRPLRSDRVHPACFLAGRRSIQQWGRHLVCGPAVLPIFCRAPLVPGPGKFREDQCPTELGWRAACQRRRQRTSRRALRPPQSGPIPWASGAGLCSLPSPASGKWGTRRQSIHSGGPESPSSLGAAPGVSPGENLCPEWGSRCWAVC